MPTTPRPQIDGPEVKAVLAEEMCESLRPMLDEEETEADLMRYAEDVFSVLDLDHVGGDPAAALVELCATKQNWVANMQVLNVIMKCVLSKGTVFQKLGMKWARENGIEVKYKLGQVVRGDRNGQPFEGRIGHIEFAQAAYLIQTEEGGQPFFVGAEDVTEADPLPEPEPAPEIETKDFAAIPALGEHVAENDGQANDRKEDRGE